MASWQQNLPHQGGVSIRPGPYDTTQTASAPAYEAQPPHATVQQQHFLGGKNPGYLHHSPGGFLQPPQIAGKPTYSSPPYAPAQYSVGGAASSMMPGGVGTVAPHQQMAGKMNTMAPIGTKGTAADPHMGGAPGMYNQHQFAAQQHLQGNSSSTLYNGGGGGQHAVRSGNANKSKGSFFGTGKGSTKGKKGGTNYRDTSPELNHRCLPHLRRDLPSPDPVVLVVYCLQQYAYAFTRKIVGNGIEVPHLRKPTSNKTGGSVAKRGVPTGGGGRGAGRPPSALWLRSWMETAP